MSRGVPVPLFIEQEIVALWKNRKPIKLIKYICKVSNTAIYKTLKKYNITRPANRVIRGQYDLFIHVNGKSRR